MERENKQYISASLAFCLLLLTFQIFDTLDMTKVIAFSLIYLIVMLMIVIENLFYRRMRRKNG